MAKAKQPRVLVVDDDPQLLQVMGMILKRANYEPYLVASGMEALERVKEIRPALVVIDMMMPLMKGTDLCRDLREQPESRSLPIIMMSSLDRLDDKLAGFQAGADDYVTKPVNPQELVARINALLVRAQLGREQIAQTVVVTGAKGGVGTSTVALNLAVALAQREYKVALLELRAGWGAQRYLTNLPAVPDLASLLERQPEKIKHTEVQEQLQTHSSGLSLLFAPAGAPSLPFTVSHTEIILSSLARDRDFLIVDLPAYGGEDVARYAMKEADSVLLVSEPEPLSTMCARTRLNTMLEWGVQAQTDVVAVARASSGLSLSRLEVENEMGLGGGESHALSYWQRQQMGLPDETPRVLAMVPPAPEAFQAATGAGVPLMLMEPSAPAARVLAKLAQHLIQHLTSEESTPARSLHL